MFELEVSWNPAKAASNFRKHGVSFEEAIGVFYDPNAITFQDLISSVDEPREITIGHTEKNRLVLVVHTEASSGLLRIISARKATKRERLSYEEGI